MNRCIFKWQRTPCSQRIQGEEADVISLPTRYLTYPYQAISAPLTKQASGPQPALFFDDRSRPRKFRFSSRSCRERLSQNSIRLDYQSGTRTLRLQYRFCRCWGLGTKNFVDKHSLPKSAKRYLSRANIGTIYDGNRPIRLSRVCHSARYCPQPDL